MPRDSVASFDPDHNAVVTRSGDRIEYEYLVIAMGIQLNYHLIKVPSVLLLYT